ncbi:MAG TPA: methyltransferase domain-containing protein [Verrucomicrobiae bacterium]|jgi:hypothetical protein|nr:methyltransferase domain-containing protein [Verrucomicrobiae bacterium]
MFEKGRNEAFELYPGAEVYLEVGYGTDPSALRGNRSFTESKLYLGVDAAEGNYYSAVNGQEYGPAVRDAIRGFQDYVRAERPQEDIRFVIGDATCLPLANESVGECYMADVLNAPLLVDTKRTLIKEAERVLKPGAKLIVKISWDYFLFPPEEVERKLRETGLLVRNRINGGGKEFQEMEAVFGTSTGLPAGVGYYVVAEKPVAGK